MGAFLFLWALTPLVCLLDLMQPGFLILDHGDVTSGTPCSIKNNEELDYPSEERGEKHPVAKLRYVHS